MRFRSNWARAAIAAPALALIALAIVAACRDSLLPDRVDAPNDARVTPREHVAIVPAQARAQLRARNPHEWVGVAHNRALDDFRKELRKPGVLTMCAFLPDFVTRIERIPADRRSSEVWLALEGSRSRIESARRCKARGHGDQSVAWSAPRATPSRTQEASLSPAATELGNTIVSSIDAAADRYDLAVRLNTVLDRAAALDPTEQTVIGAAVSTAQNSYEYWEDQLPAADQEFHDEYASCLATGGTSSDDAYSACVDGGAAQSAAPMHERRLPSVVRLAVYSGTMDCYISGHWKQLAEADAIGAIVGGIRGGILGGPGGILAGAFAGAAYGSLTSWLHSEGQLWWCAMQ